MGSDYHVSVIRDRTDDAEYDRLAAGIFAALDRVDREMSTYKPDSDVSRVSAAPAGEAVKVSADTIAVLQLALQIAAETDGAFDPTIAPLVDLWGFGPAKTGVEPPMQEAIDAAAALVDWRTLQLDENRNTVTKTRDGVRLDLSAVAQGYAVDEVCRYLDSEGVAEYMVELSGDVRARGRNLDGIPWRIGIDKPIVGNAPGVDLQTVVSIENMAVTTNGDYRNFREVGGVRVSHTIDPRTKRPISHGLASVSVIASTCTEADALDTAVAVLGPDKGYEYIARRPAAEAYLIVRDEAGGFSIRQTPAFFRFIAADTP